MASLPGAAGVAIRIALQDDEYGHNQLRRYLEELDDEQLTDLKDAADRTGDVASFILGRRHT